MAPRGNVCGVSPFARPVYVRNSQGVDVDKCWKCITQLAIGFARSPIFLYSNNGHFVFNTKI